MILIAALGLVAWTITSDQRTTRLAKLIDAARSKTTDNTHR
jgi:hypothetical protein